MASHDHDGFIKYMVEHEVPHRNLISRPRVIIESPFAGDIERNLTYLRRALRDSIVNHSENPFASHGLYTQPGVLDDSNPTEREIGINLGFGWILAAQKVIFYVDYGMSPGMNEAGRRADEWRIETEIRTIGKNP